MKEISRSCCFVFCVIIGLLGQGRAQIKLHTNGKTTFGPIPSQMPAERVVIDGGNDMALKLKVSQTSNWY